MLIDSFATFDLPARVIECGTDRVSGHYRPHLANFRAFHHSLQSRGADLSHVSISKSYATLAGIEGYASTKHKVHRMHEMLEEATDKLHLRHLDDPE